MLIVKIKDSKSIDRALKILKTKVTQTGQNKELRNRMEYKKPSVKKREEKMKAIYKNKLNLDSE